MLKPLTTAVVAASVWAAAFALPATALAKDADAATAQATSSSVVDARAQAAPQATAPAVKRVRKVQPRRVAAVAAPSPYPSQCFLFWCSGPGRPFHFLVLGVAY